MFGDEFDRSVDVLGWLLGERVIIGFNGQDAFPFGSNQSVEETWIIGLSRSDLHIQDFFLPVNFFNFLVLEVNVEHAPFILVKNRGRIEASARNMSDVRQTPIRLSRSSRIFFTVSGLP